MFTAISWQDVQKLNQRQLPASVRPWLLDKGSLTERLISASGGNFRVERISQGWQVPTADEAMLLHLKPRQVALVREVFLWCNDEPWVYARSVIPKTSLDGSLGFLRKLKNSALGGLLFKDPFLQRSAFEVAAIQLPCDTIPFTSNEMVFGRRSLFHLKRQPLLVAEIFLPSCQLTNKVNQPKGV
jgi:chorismate--pyruvate lyase